MNACIQHYDAAEFLPLLSHMPLLDVRSPAEFTRGYIPGALNMSLFADDERAIVGTLYVQEGHQAALLRGLAIAGPKLEGLVRFALAAQTPLRQQPDPEESKKLPAVSPDAAPEIAVHCWRGGMRSNSVAWLLHTAGFQVHVLRGGYKAFRRYVLDFFERPLPLVALGGKTGSGKTEALAFLRRRAQIIDLEGLARHRGSAFGGHENETQPTTEHFENLLAMELAVHDVHSPIWVEDESENLGSVNLPRAFYHQLRAAPLVLMETPHDARLARVLRDYGKQQPEGIVAALDRIKKRLGGLEHKRAQEALATQDLPTVAGILLDYYDRAYAKQILNRPPVATVTACSPEAAAARLAELPLPEVAMNSIP